MIAALAFATALSSQFATIARDITGRVGVQAVVLETGETASLRAGERFPMQSVYKLPIAMAVLNEVDRGRLKLDRRVKVGKGEYISPGQHSPLRDRHPAGGAEITILELLRLAVSESDGTASDVLMRIIDGPAEVMEYLRGIGIDEIAVADTEMQLGRDHQAQYRNWATPRAAVQLLKIVHDQRTRHEGLLLKLMTESPTGPRRLKGRLPADTTVAHKTGTSGTRNGLTAATNDIGLITLPSGRHLAIAVFVADARGAQEQREAVIARIAEAAYTHWTVTPSRPATTRP